MRASLEQHLGSRQVGRVVYGSIIGMALVVAIESHPPKPGVMAVWLVGTAIAVGLAEDYSEGVGNGTRTRQAGTRGAVGHMNGGPCAGGFRGRVPAVFFLLSTLGVFAVDTAFT